LTLLLSFNFQREIGVHIMQFVQLYLEFLNLHLNLPFISMHLFAKRINLLCKSFNASILLLKNHVNIALRSLFLFFLQILHFFHFVIELCHNYLNFCVKQFLLQVIKILDTKATIIFVHVSHQILNCIIQFLINLFLVILIFIVIPSLA